MPIFLSYARTDAAPVQELYEDLESIRGPIWMDTRLTGGQEWWDAILEQIRGCDLFVYALSPDSIESEACEAELDYALAMGRPILPVMIRWVAMDNAPPEVARTHCVDYRQASREGFRQLVAAVSKPAEARPLPDPLPSPPPPPMSYLNVFHDILRRPSLSYTEQQHLLVDLRGYFELGGKKADSARRLLHTLRGRQDVARRVADEIDRLLAVPILTSAPIPSSGTTPMAGPAPRPDQAPNPPRQPTPSPTRQRPPSPDTVRHPSATAVLVLGIVSIVSPVLGIGLGVIGLVMGRRALREVGGRPGVFSGRSQLTVGFWLSIVGVVIQTAYLALIIYLSAASGGS